MALLEARKLSKAFGGLQALFEVSLTIERGEIYGLIGPNGAGKTTMFNVLTGLYRPTSGSFLFNGTDLTGRKPHIIVEAGIARTFQNIRLFAHMTAIENAMVGRHLRTHAGAVGAVLRDAWTGALEVGIRGRAQELLITWESAVTRTPKPRTVLRRSAPAGDRARARDRAEAARARRAGRRHERHRDRGAARPARAGARRRRHDPAHRT
jgi:ABC-type branched-subunit amino acid transport system ATPase component